MWFFMVVILTPSLFIDYSIKSTRISIPNKVTILNTDIEIAFFISSLCPSIDLHTFYILELFIIFRMDIKRTLTIAAEIFQKIVLEIGLISFEHFETRFSSY